MSQASDPASQESDLATQASDPARKSLDGQKENLTILQNFVPYCGRYLATAQLQLKYSTKRSKGTANHIMPLGD